MEGAPDPVAQAFLQKLEFTKRAQLIRTRLAQASSKLNPSGAAHAPLSSSSASDASSAATSCDQLLADALRVEVRAGKRKASAAELEDPLEPPAAARQLRVDVTREGRRGLAEGALAETGEKKPSLWEVMLLPPAPQHHPASPGAALPHGLGYGYPPPSAASYHNYRDSPGAGYDPYDAYRPQMPASPSFYASPDPNASSFAAPFSSQARSTPVTSSMRGGHASLGVASPRRLDADAASLRVPSPGGRLPGSSGSFGRSPSSTFPRPPPTAAAANHSYAQGLTTSPIINSSPKISSARTSIPVGATGSDSRPTPVSAGAASSVIHPSPLGGPGPSHYPPGFGPPPHLPSRLQQHRQRLGGIASPGSPKAADGLAGSPVPVSVRGHRRTVSSTLSAVVNFQNAQRASPQAKGPVEEYLTHHASPGRSPRKRRRTPPPSAPAQIGRPSNLADISAASALTAMLTSNGSVSSQRGSTEPSESGASSSRPPLGRARSSTPPPPPPRRMSKPGEDDAAGMLMFFHHSPSPAKPRATPRPRDVSGTGPPPPAAAARGRVLLFDEPSGGAFGAALKGNTTSPGGRSNAAATSSTGEASQEVGPSSHGLTRQSSQRSPKKARLGSNGGGIGSLAEQPGADGGESGKENRGTPGADGDPDSSSSSLFSQLEGAARAPLPPAVVATCPPPTTLSQATSLSSSHPGVSPPSPSTSLLTPAPSSLPAFISPARSPSPDMHYPPPSNSTHASPDRPSTGSAAVKTGLNPTLAPSAVVQAGATASWPDFAFLAGGSSSGAAAGGAAVSSPRKSLRDGVKEGSPVVQIGQQKLGGVA